MSLPVWSTTITVLRDQADPYADPYAGAPVLAPVASGVHAVLDVSTFGANAGQEFLRGGQQTRILLRLLCDLCDLDNNDWIEDEQTGIRYRVTWHMRYLTGTAEEHIQGGAETVEGLV